MTIRILRRRQGVSQETLALDAKVSRRYMSSIEQGHHNPSVELICRLLSALKITWAVFGSEFDMHLKSEKNKPQ